MSLFVINFEHVLTVEPPPYNEHFGTKYRIAPKIVAQYFHEYMIITKILSHFILIDVWILCAAWHLRYQA